MTVYSLDDIFRYIQKGEIFCIFNQVPRMKDGKEDSLWCNNFMICLTGDMNGAEFICNQCLHKNFDYSKVELKQ